MAQQVKIAGALFNDVPYIQCPDVNDVYHPFVDPSVTTAAASDVAQGKQFIAADGTLTQGTASGGGTSIVWGIIRGDATLVKSWTYDKKIYADEGVTIPSYSTSNQTLKSGSALTTESLNFADYSYALIYRQLVSPIYSNTVNSGQQICWMLCGYHSMAYINPSVFSYNGIMASSAQSSSPFNNTAPSTAGRIFYKASASSLRMAAVSYGAYMNVPANPSVTLSSTSPYTTGTLTITSPGFMVRGSSTYLSSTAWGYMTDIRYQYIYDLYRVPRSSTVNGWEVESQYKHIVDCVNGNGTLT